MLPPINRRNIAAPCFFGDRSANFVQTLTIFQQSSKVLKERGGWGIIKIATSHFYDNKVGIFSSASTNIK